MIQHLPILEDCREYAVNTRRIKEINLLSLCSDVI